MLLSHHHPPHPPPFVHPITEPWQAFFTLLPEASKVEVYERMWDACTTEERDFIVRDIATFFAPSIGDEGAAGGDGPTAVTGGEVGSRAGAGSSRH